MSIKTTLSTPLELPSGAVIKNRLLKSAMSEILGTVDHAPSSGLPKLYGAWADGGLGLAVTGNVMVDRRALGEPRNVVIEDDRNLVDLTRWAKAGTRNNTGLWMQINHPGKQSPSFLSPEPVAPSAIPFKSEIKAIFNPPRALSENEIQDLINRWGNAARIAVRAGFNGIQIHGAHGYLVSQFLSPRHNQRTDRWGGSLENRTRFVVEIYRSIRTQVGSAVPVSIKINSADFQKGGFTEAESMEVIKTLAAEGMDLIEISGGNYESPSMVGANMRESTAKREAYFLKFAEQVRSQTDVPLAVTGGFRTRDVMESAISQGAVDMVGLARPLAIDPQLPNKIFAGQDYDSSVRPLSTGFETVDRFSMLEVTWYENQMARIAAGKQPKPNMSPWQSIAMSVAKNGFQAFQLRRAK